MPTEEYKPILEAGFTDKDVLSLFFHIFYKSPGRFSTIRNVSYSKGKPNYPFENATGYKYNSKQAKFYTESDILYSGVFKFQELFASRTIWTPSKLGNFLYELEPQTHYEINFALSNTKQHQKIQGEMASKIFNIIHNYARQQKNFKMKVEDAYSKIIAHAMQKTAQEREEITANFNRFLQEEFYHRPGRL